MLAGSERDPGDEDVAEPPMFEVMRDVWVLAPAPIPPEWLDWIDKMRAFATSWREERCKL